MSMDNLKYEFDNGSTLQRENGKTPNGNKMGGKWVLRDNTGALVDFDTYRNDVAERNGLINQRRESMTKLEKLLGKENAKILLDSAYDLDKSLPFIADFASAVENCEDTSRVITEYLLQMSESISYLTKELANKQ